MENITFFIWLAICVITHLIRTGYEILKHKNKIKPNKVSFIIVFTNMLLLWVSWFMLCSVDPHKVNIPAVIQYFGLLLFFAGFVIFLTSLFTIKTLESYDGDLITTGIYSRIRHPMYLSFILWLFGLSIYNGALVSFIISFVLMSNILYWRHLEEIELVNRFPGYKEYKKKTIF